MKQKDAIKRFFRRKRTKEKLEQIGAPDDIIDSSQKIYCESVEELSCIGVDAEKYVESSSGAIEYMIFCTHFDQQDEVRLRCEECKSYELLNEGFRCKYKFEFPLVCKEYNKSEIDLIQRVQTKCHQCRFLVNKECIGNIEKMDTIKCSKNMNQANPDCIGYEEESA